MDFMVICVTYHIRPVVDEDFRGPVRAQLQGLLHQRDVLYSSAWLDAKRGGNHQLGLKNTEIMYELDSFKISNGRTYNIMTLDRHSSQNSHRRVLTRY